MALFPLQGMFDGDFVVVLVPVDDQDTMSQVAEKVAHHAVGRRIAPQDKPYTLRHDGHVVPLDATVTSAGFAPMAIVEVGYAS